MAKYDKSALLADYHTGDYSQRQLAKKHKISNGTVANLTKGLDKKNERLIQKKVEVEQELKLLNDQELSAIEHSVKFKIDMLNDIEKFSTAAIKKAIQLMDKSDAGNDFKAVVEGVDKLSILTKINDRHAKPASMQQNTQNNSDQPITRVFHVVE
jgi:DNA-binding transcriptional MocR family regulator